MSDGIQIQLKGADNVKAALVEFQDYLPKQYIRTALNKAAQLLQGFLVLLAPKLTGRLARNIVVRFRKTHAQIIVNTQGKRGDPNNAFYWRFLEEGFHDRAGKEHKYPFIQGVMDAKEQQAAQMVIDSVGAALDRAEARAKSAGSPQ